MSQAGFQLKDHFHSQESFLPRNSPFWFKNVTLGPNSRGGLQYRFLVISFPLYSLVRSVSACKDSSESQGLAVGSRAESRPQPRSTCSPVCSCGNSAKLCVPLSVPGTGSDTLAEGWPLSPCGRCGAGSAACSLVSPAHASQSCPTAPEPYLLHPLVRWGTGGSRGQLTCLRSPTLRCVVVAQAVVPREPPSLSSTAMCPGLLKALPPDPSLQGHCVSANPLCRA